MTDHFLPRFVESQSENSSVVNTRCVASNRTDGGHERADKFCNILAYQPGGDTKNRLSVTMPTLPHLHCKDKYSGDTADERSYLNANGSLWNRHDKPNSHIKPSTRARNVISTSVF